MERRKAVSLLAGLLLCAGANHVSAQSQRRVTALAGDEILPQFVYGGGWRTTVSLVNMSATSVSLPIRFYTDTGDAWRVQLDGSGPSTAIQATIGPNATFTFSASANLANVQQGWVWADIPTAADVSGFAIFQQRVDGRPDFEAVVPLSSWITDRSYMIFDNTQGYSTGLVVLNGDRIFPEIPDTITIAIRDENGERIWIDQFSMRGMTRQIFSLADRFPQTVGRRGSIELTSSGLSVAVLGLRFNPSGAFTSTHSLEP